MSKEKKDAPEEDDALLEMTVGDSADVEPEVEPEPVPEPPAPVKRSARELRRQSLLEKVKMLKPKILKLYKHKGFPSTKFGALTPARFLKNFGMDEKDEELLRAVAVAWHYLHDAKKVGSTHMYRPRDEISEKLPF